jgi:hypothetical protein
MVIRWGRGVVSVAVAMSRVGVVAAPARAGDSRVIVMITTGARAELDGSRHRHDYRRRN